MDFFSSCLKLLREMSLTASGWGGFFWGEGGGSVAVIHCIMC